MPKSTKQYYQRLGGAYTAFAQKTRRTGDLGPRVAEIRKQMEEDRERHQSRIQLLGQAMKLAGSLEENRERLRLFRRGAQEMGIDVGEPSILEKIGITGPDVEGMYGPYGVKGTGLLQVGRTAEVMPGAVPTAMDVARRYFSFSDIPSEEVFRPSPIEDIRGYKFRGLPF